MNAPLSPDQMALLMSNSLSYSAAIANAPLSIGTRLRLFVAYLRSLPQRRAVMNELAALTDRELADIGLHRAEMGRVFDEKFVEARGHSFGR